MTQFSISSKGREDIWTIWQYLAKNSGIVIANRIEAELFDIFEELATMPGLGHTRKDLTHHDVLFFPLYQYLIVYRENTPLEVIAVVHGKRDVKRVLASRVI